MSTTKTTVRIGAGNYEATFKQGGVTVLIDLSKAGRHDRANLAVAICEQHGIKDKAAPKKGRPRTRKPKKQEATHE